MSVLRVTLEGQSVHVYMHVRKELVKWCMSCSEQDFIVHLHVCANLSGLCLNKTDIACCVRFGASILIESITTSAVYTQLASNPQCPFLHEDMNAIPQDWTEVTSCAPHL